MVHQYKLSGYNIVLDVDSGSVHLVDDLVYEIISLYGKAGVDSIVQALSDRFDSGEIRSAFGDVRALAEEGKLFSSADHEKRHYQGDREEVIKALCLNVAHTCNLNCSYCFAGQGRYKGGEALMSPETGRRAIDFLIERSGSRRNLEVDFFGGEPLLNWQMVKDVVAYARSLEKRHSKHFRFTLTTNGVLIDEDVIAFTNREMHNVVLSLDGRPEVHNRFRVDIGGKGSYARVVPRFRELVKRRTRGTYYVRGTFTHANTDFLNDILHLLDLGFREISMEPVVCQPGEPYALTEEDMPFIKEQYEKLAEEMLRRERAGEPFEFYHFMIDLERGPCIYKRIKGCGSGTEYLAVTPAGDLYPCHQFVDNPAFRIGSLWDGVTDNNLQDRFRRCNVFSRPECRDCWAKFYCAGGCAANAFHRTGDVLGVDAYGCELFRKRVECAIMMKAAKAAESQTEQGLFSIWSQRGAGSTPERESVKDSF